MSARPGEGPRPGCAWKGPKVCRSSMFQTTRCRGGECEFDGAYSSNCAEGETSGVLQPGHYVLEAHAGGGAATWPSNPSLWEGYADATYTVTLALPRGVPALSGRSAGLLGLVLLALGVLAPSQIRTRKRGRW